MGEIISFIVGTMVGICGLAFYFNPAITEAKNTNQDLKVELNSCQKDLEKTNTLMQGGLMFK